MRVGVVVLPDLSWAEQRPRWQAVEEMGFAHGWTYDHLVWGGLPDAPWRSAVPLLAAAATATTRLGLGTLVASPNFRHPYLLHRDAQTLEDVSDGRFLLGVGTGGDLDSRVLGDEPLSVRDRVDRFQEHVRLLVRLRDDDHVDADGRWFSTAGARTLPPLRRTPLLLAGNGPRSVRFAAATGDGWVTTGPHTDDLDAWFSGLAASAAVLDEALDGQQGFTRTLLLDTAPSFSGGEGRVALSSVAFFEELVGRAAGLGFTDVVVHWPRTEEPYRADGRVLEAVAGEVLPRLAGGSGAG